MPIKLIPRLRSLARGFIALLIVMLVAVSTFAWFPSQNPKKVFKRQWMIGPEIVQVVEIENNNKKVEFDVGIHAGEDWLSGTTFTLKNYSGRTIVFIALHLNFPETKSSGNEMSFPIYVGRHPDLNQTGVPIAIGPEEEIAIKIDDKRYASLKKFLEYRQPITNINQVTVLPYLVVFEDGIAWGQGEYYRHDPANKRYMPIGLKPPE